LLEKYAGNDKWEAEIRSVRNDFMAAATHLLPYDPLRRPSFREHGKEASR
jgi:hypothetical protein